MTLRPGFDTACDLLKKLHREADRLDAEVTVDDFFNFAVAGWQIRDWVEADPNVPASLKAALSAVTSKKCIQACRNLANSSKHFEITKYTPSVLKAETRSGYGLGRYGKGPFGVGEQSIRITLKDGSQFDALSLASEVVAAWDGLLGAHCA